ncbi:MAG: S8 family serine peptidase, partial [Thermomicrobiales bacterium]
MDPAIPGQVAVRLNPGVDLNAFAGDYGIPATPLRDVASRNIYLLTIPGTVMPNEEEAFANMLDADPRTRWAELNYFGDTPEGSGRTFWFNEVTLPGSYVGQDAWPQIGLDQAQGIQNTAAGMTIAVVDSGVDTMHPALADANIMTGYNFLNDTTDVADVFPGADADGDGDVDESAGHGTHVSGVVAHIAPQVNIVPLKVLDSEGNTNNFLLGEAMFAAIDANAD